MITFRILGTLDLRDRAGRPLASPLVGSKRLALLAVLALHDGRGVRRDTLLGWFWPELEQDRARNSLSNMVHQIRRALGSGTVVGQGDEVRLGENAVWCDATAFQTALAANELADALELYRGDLLAGVFVQGASAEFEHWLDTERFRLRQQAAYAASALAISSERQARLADAVKWARRAAALDPFDEPAVRRLILLLDRAGDRAGALRAYEELSARLAQEFDAEPSAETRAAIDEVRARNEVTGLARSARTIATPDVPDTSMRNRAEEAPSAHSIAVLPFENLSGSPMAEPFALGLHDDLLTELSRISALRVIARTSVMRYRDAREPLPDIARELGVGTIIEGAVQSAGDRLRLNIQMIDARTGAHRWAERYDRELSTGGIFALQTELAGRIASALKAELTPAERAHAVRERATGSLDAYRLYAQGRAYLDQRTEAGMRRALDCFERAVDLDPSYALAWTGLADALSLLHDYGYEEPDRVLPQAEQAVRRALALAPDMAEAHASLGEFHVSRRDGASAIRALRRATELRSSYAEAHNWLGWMSQVMGDREQALASAEWAVGLDPLSPEVTSNVALSLITNGRPAEALVVARRTHDLQPDWTTGRFFEGLALYEIGSFAEAVRVLDGLVVEWAGSGPTLTLALAHAAAGDHGTAHRLSDEFARGEDPYAAGLVQLALGRRREAESYLRRVTCWDYWPALSLHHLYTDVFAVIREDPLHDWMLHEVEQWWQRDPIAPIEGATPE
ncbi:MAG TPA: BTAD domain-containing putative transcriptional regulator [Longimicrobiales bacterium]|nr:BTAD domain-containing putative transcriptional regulator [Longimicrobiales bacterium]